MEIKKKGKTWKELSSPQTESTWVSQLTELAKTPEAEISSSSFFPSQLIFLLFLWQTDQWKKSSPLLPISKCGHFPFALAIFVFFVMRLRASLIAQTVKHMPAMQETQVQTLGWEDPLKKGMATHSSILA